MPSSWGNSWGKSWGNSWGFVEVEIKDFARGGSVIYAHPISDKREKREEEEILLMMKIFTKVCL